MSVVERCPERNGEPHIWAGAKASGDGNNPCVFCGTPGRLEQQPRETNQGHFARATAARTFVGVSVPMQSGTGDPVKAWPKGQPPEMAARAGAIVADKKRRDAEAVASGTARPGQLAGAPKKGRA